MGFFGIGGSKKKKDETAEGIVHDTKRDAPDASKDILDEFEAQFSQGGPVEAPNEASRSPPVQQAASSASHEDFKPPSAPPRPSQAPPASQAPPSQPTRPGANAPGPQRAPQPPTRSAPEHATPPPTEHHDPTPSGRDDLPDFDFDFHPSQPQDPAPGAAPSQPSPSPPQSPPQPQQNPPSQPAQHEGPFQQRPFETPSQPRRPEPQAPEAQEPPPRSDRFDLPDFSSDAFETRSTPEAQRMPERRPKTWDDLTAPSGTRPWQSAPARPEPIDRAPGSQAQNRPEQPAQEQPAAAQRPRYERASEPQEVFMRGGTLYIEKHALIRHVHDLTDLKGLSTSTGEQFKRIDSLAEDEKKTLDKMQSAIQALHDTLEQTDELLFKGE